MEYAQGSRLWSGKFCFSGGLKGTFSSYDEVRTKSLDMQSYPLSACLDTNEKIHKYFYYIFSKDMTKIKYIR